MPAVTRSTMTPTRRRTGRLPSPADSRFRVAQGAPPIGGASSRPLGEVRGRDYRTDGSQASCDPPQADVLPMVESVELARDAMVRHAWPEALDAFLAADRDGRLEAGDLEQLGAAAWWAGQPDASAEAGERAFAAYLAAGQTDDAARVAFSLAYQAFRRRSISVATGW